MFDWQKLIPSLVAVPLGGTLLLRGMPDGAAPANVLLMLWGLMLITVGAGVAVHAWRLRFGR